MSVLLETSLGDLTIDLDTTLAPKASQNFRQSATAQSEANWRIELIEQGCGYRRRASAHATTSERDAAMRIRWRHPLISAL